MNRTALAMIGTLMLAATPLASYAGPNQAFDACVKSFVETYIPKDRVVRVRKQHPPAGPLDALSYRKNVYTIALSAGGARSGKEIAQARCVASNNCQVIVLDSPPPDTYVSEADFAAVVAR